MTDSMASKTSSISKGARKRTGSPEQPVGSDGVSSQSEIEAGSSRTIAEQSNLARAELPPISAFGSRRMKKPRTAEQEAQEQQRVADSFRNFEERKAAENALSDEEKRLRVVDNERRWLADHIQPKIQAYRSAWTQEIVERKLDPEQPYVEFLFQLARYEAKCRFMRCEHKEKKIRADDYRIGVSPGDHWSKSPNYYHVNCFEELCDFGSLDYLARFNDKCKFRADDGAHAIFITWKRDLVRQAREAANSIRSTADAVPQPEARERNLEDQQPALAPSRQNETPDELYTKLTTNQHIGYDVTAEDIAVVLAEKRIEGFVRSWDSVDFTIKPVEVLDKDLGNGEFTWKEYDGDSDWQILDCFVDGKAHEADRDAGVETARDNETRSDVKARVLSDSQHRLSQALDVWGIDRLIALSEPEDLTDEGKQMKAQFTKGDIFRIQGKWDDSSQRLEGRRREDVESAEEIERQLRAMEHDQRPVDTEHAIGHGR